MVMAVIVILMMITSVIVFTRGINDSIESNTLCSNINSQNENLSEDNDLIDEMNRLNNERFMQESMDENMKIITPFSEGGYDLTHDMNNDMNNFDMF